MREILSIHVGKTGIKTGEAFWKQMILEHSIEQNGICSSTPIGNPQICFEETSKGKFVPRAAFVDLEPSQVDSVSSSGLGKLFDPSAFITGKDGSHNNWAEAKYAYGSEKIDEIMDFVRKKAEACEKLEGFYLSHSISGGVGSGLLPLILSKIDEEYPMGIKITSTLFPSPSSSSIVVEPFNAAHAVHQLTENCTITVVFDNEAIQKHCESQMLSKDFDSYNEIIAKTMCTILSTARFKSQPNMSLRKLAMNLVAYPRTHFVVPTFTSETELANDALLADRLTSTFLKCENTLASIDLGQGRILEANTFFRGALSY